MIELKTTELIGPPLDWAVAQIEDVTVKREYSGNDGNGNCVIWLSYKKRAGEFAYSPSTDWRLGGPMVEKYEVCIICARTGDPTKGRTGDGIWSAKLRDLDTDYGHLNPTALIAACRAIVRAKLGDVVQVPAELVQS